MKIKKVEQKTNLSAKAIRLYEEKGLIKVKRDENDYRHYTNENIIDLWKIKLFRKCGLSLTEIKDVINQNNDLNELLYNKISECEKNIENLNDQKELCLNVIKANGNYDKLFEYIQTIESEEYITLMDELNGLDQQSLATQIFQTIMLLGPMLSFLLFYDMNKTQLLLPAFILSLISCTFMTLSWSSFIRKYKFTKETVLQGLMHTIRLLILFFIFIVIVLFCLLGISFLQISLFMKKDVYILSPSGFTIGFSILLMMSIFVMILALYGKHFHFKEYVGYEIILNWVKAHKLVYLLMIVITFYLALFNTTTISKNEIVHYTPLNPNGTIYQYEDITSIECGFLGTSLFTFREKGDFYYYIHMNDGETLKINDTQTTKEYEDDTYSELVVLDQDIMRYGVTKISSEENSEFALLDQIYIERFITIINNK